MAAAHLLDTNALLRLARREDSEHILIKTAIDRLIEGGAGLCYTPQNVVEFWNVLTRPTKQNGFGLTVSDAHREVSLIEKRFIFLPDDERIHTEWRRLVVAHSVSGAKVHDARLVAAMRVHGITHLLTLNANDFARYSGITAVHPNTLAG
ncbi:MAG: type II toxin-antitoxin system VapC family toxin [Bryobacteraceae bacterium]